MHSICVLALDNVIAFDLALAVETFRRARLADGSPAYTVTVAGPQPLVRSGPISIAVPNGLSALDTADTIIVPGRENPDSAADEDVISALQRAHHRGARLASICVGAFDLAATGLLDGREATTHWNAVELFAASFPQVRVNASVLFIDEGRVLTSAGAAAGIDLCLHMIESDWGSSVALDAARLAVTAIARDGGQSQFIVRPAVTASSSSLAAVLEWMTERLASTITLDDIALIARVSVRTLSRRFQDQLGTTPMAWLVSARVRLARSMLETTDNSIELIAASCGLGSAQNLRIRFAIEVGLSPSRYRSAFRARPTPRAGVGD